MEEWRMQLVRDIAVLSATPSSLLPKVAMELWSVAGNPWNSRNKLLIFKQGGDSIWLMH
jgi:hypothetical protein